MNLLGRIGTSLARLFQVNKSPTVRYAFPLVFAAVAFLGAQAITAQNASTITVEPTTNSLREGEPFSVNIYVTAHVEVNAVDLELTFPTDRMKVTGIDTGESVITLWTDDPYVEGNTVFLRGGTFRRGFIGQHLIATVNAEALTSGIADIAVNDFLLLAGDGSGSEVAVDDDANEDAKIYIANEDGTFNTSNLLGVETGSSISGVVSISIVTDIDGSGDVSLEDISRFMAAWFDGTVVYDFNGDGQMTFRDFGIILSDSFFK